VSLSRDYVLRVRIADPVPWNIDRSARGLEIGPLHKPRLAKADYNVLYVDHLPTRKLIEKYHEDPDVDHIAPVDIVWSGDRPIVHAVGEGTVFHYVLASHVLEHVPNPIGWLGDLSSVLVPGGFIALVIPDKRFCFDIRRPESRVWDVVDAYLRGATTPSPRQIYEFASLYLPVDTTALWRGVPGVGESERTDVGDVDVFSFNLCRHAIDTGEYEDVHCWAFTPESFVDLYERLVRLKLVGLGIERVYPTRWGSLEFYVTLRKPVSGQGMEWLRALNERGRLAASNASDPDTRWRNLIRRIRRVAPHLPPG
jgi:hypothetical protein